MKEKFVDKLYDRINSGGACYYCGEKAKGKDHCPPTSSAHMFLGTGAQFVIVEACDTCNKRLSNLALPTLEDRISYLRRKYRNLEHYKYELLKSLHGA